MSIKKLLIKIAYVCMVLVWLEGCQGCHRVVISPSEQSQIPDQGGIPNLGATCYMNAVLQIIAKLYPDIFASAHSDLTKAGQVIVNKIKDDQDYVTGKEAEVFYTALLNEAGGRFTRYRQEDASECISVLLYDNSFTTIPSYSSWERTTDLTGNHEYRAWSMKNTERYLQLPIPGNGNCTMQECLEEAFQNSELTEDNQLDHNGTKVDANTEHKLVVDGSSLFPIFLRRFEYDKNAKKKNNSIQDSFQLIIPNTIQYNGRKDLKYTLKGFIQHSGKSAHSGHYVAYIQNRTGQWVKYNDENVTILTNEPLQEAEKAYLYFYQAD